MALPVGQPAPPFDTLTDAGTPIRLEDYRGKKYVVLFFYPGDFTPICTAEACGFRDMYAELVDKDTEIIGISSDSMESHGKFKSKYALPFPLIADDGKKLATLYGATNFLTAILGRTTRLTYVLDKELVVRAVVSAQLSASAHTREVREAIGRLRAA